MISYQEFCNILNKHVFDNEEKDLLKKIAENPERFIGSFRSSKPNAKILQYLLQSREIKFGDALEELMEKILKNLGYDSLNKIIFTEKEEYLSLDQFFTDGKKYFFIEQKVRDDHNSSKKRGQIDNFKAKLKELVIEYKQNIIGIMYFIDPEFTKNKNFYTNEIKKLEKIYNIPLYLFYGKELFEFLKVPDCWNVLFNMLIKWKNSLPNIPDINFDKEPIVNFEKIKDLELRYWRKLLYNQKLWDEGIMKILFKTGESLNMLLNYFNGKKQKAYTELSLILQERLHHYYQNELSRIPYMGWFASNRKNITDKNVIM